jgi:phosphoesterase RecJ-like protein
MIDRKKTEELKTLLATPRRIVIVSHTNPDGDALGSGLAWMRVLEKQGHHVRFIVPNAWPAFLEWMAGIGHVAIYKADQQACAEAIETAEAIFCLDLNRIDRLEQLGEKIIENKTARRILIDHHLDPPQEYALMFSDTAASSTSLMVYRLVEAMGWDALVDYPVAEALYVGICTDTGNFSYGNLTPEVFRIAARLIEKGVDPARLNIAIYDNYSADRMRLMGYLLNEKMEIVAERHAAWMSLDHKEQKQHHFQSGDSEGFVNLPLAIRDITLTAFFLETKECIKVSLRSQGEVDVNRIARKYYNGGGHKNAAGGKHFGPMEQAVELFKQCLESDLDGD